ncbi:hypothetical protein [Clostridium amazonitimonense]|uniref:hypothetical protein n=1 Tax=Clostridium amazonitimonense TaxID=1499689 RepID=UPI0005097C0E|nr:hypothetical protein [Clostridium amazonitimonense]
MIWNFKKSIILTLTVIFLIEIILICTNNIYREAFKDYNTLPTSNMEGYNVQREFDINNISISDVLAFNEKEGFSINSIKYNEEEINLSVDFTTNKEGFIQYLLVLKDSKETINIEEINIISEEEDIIKGYLILKTT